MNNVTLYAGLDYHQQSIQVCVMDQQARVRLNRACPNDLAALTTMLEAAGAVRAIALEACCGAADLAERLVAAGSWRVELAHAGYVARIKGSPDKTDYTDARLLADLTRVGYLPRVWLAPRSIREIRQLLAHRQSLVDQRRALKLQIGGLLREHRVMISTAGRWTRRWVAAIEQHEALSDAVRWILRQKFAQIQQVSVWVKAAQEQLRQATVGHELLGRLRSIEGIGEVTAWTLLAYIGRFDRFRTGKQLARYCGLSPKNASSGQRQADGGLINACSKPLRAVLIQAAQRLLWRPGRWQALAEKMQKKGKPKCLVVAAVANRWVRSLHHRMLVPAELTG